MPARRRRRELRRRTPERHVWISGWSLPVAVLDGQERGHRLGTHFSREVRFAHSAPSTLADAGSLPFAPRSSGSSAEPRAEERVGNDVPASLPFMREQGELPFDEPQVLREGRQVRSRARQFGQRVPQVSMGAASSFCHDTEDRPASAGATAGRGAGTRLPSASGQASAASNAVTLRVSLLSSTPIRWIGSPYARYLSA